MGSIRTMDIKIVKNLPDEPTKVCTRETTILNIWNISEALFVGNLSLDSYRDEIDKISKPYWLSKLHERI